MSTYTPAAVVLWNALNPDYSDCKMLFDYLVSHSIQPEPVMSNWTTVSYKVMDNKGTAFNVPRAYHEEYL